MKSGHCTASDSDEEQRHQGWRVRGHAVQRFLDVTGQGFALTPGTGEPGNVLGGRDIGAGDTSTPPASLRDFPTTEESS